MGSGVNNLKGYRVEFKNESGKWKEARFDSSEHGVPYPLISKGFLYDHSLLGFEQAMALAWTLNAQKASGHEHKEKIFGLRLVQYDVSYEYEIIRSENEPEDIEDISVKKEIKINDDENPMNLLDNWLEFKKSMSGIPNVKEFIRCVDKLLLAIDMSFDSGTGYVPFGDIKIEFELLCKARGDEKQWRTH